VIPPCGQNEVGSIVHSTDAVKVIDWPIQQRGAVKLSDGPDIRTNVRSVGDHMPVFAAKFSLLIRYGFGGSKLFIRGSGLYLRAGYQNHRRNDNDAACQDMQVYALV